MNVFIHEDNSGTLVLAKTLPPQFTPQSKYHAIKTIWFRDEIFKRDIQLNEVDTVEQLGDIFIKGLTIVVFRISPKEDQGMVIHYILSYGFEPWILDSSLERECCTRSYIWYCIVGFIKG
jgi:hypothetical protein